MSAITRPIPPMIGRMTNGGLSMTSSPLNLVSMRAGVANVIGVLEGDGSGVGEASGEGVVAAACRVKLAQGFGATLAHSLWRPGGSPGKGLTFHVKLPLASASVAPETLFD
jgi:hypothetical protein